MGSSLSYWTIESVPANVKAQIAVEAATVGQRHAWWGEPLHFFDWPGKETKLAGDSRVYLESRETASGNAVEADPDDYEFMFYRDSRFIIDQLERWSSAHAISWQLVFAGQDVGTIQGGQADAALAGWLREIAQTVGAGDGTGDDERARAILARYGA